MDVGSSWEVVGSDMMNERKEKFQMWLLRNYPEVSIPFDRTPIRYVRSQWFTILYVQIAVTIVLGALTRFHSDNVSHAVWQLLWVYGGTIITLMKSEAGEYHSSIRVGLAGLSAVVLPVMALGGLGGAAVAFTGIYGSICGTTLSTSPWIMILWICALPVAYTALCAIGMVA